MPVKSRDSSGSARHLQRRLGRRRSAFFFFLPRTVAIKVERDTPMTCAHPPGGGGETVHLTVLNERQFPSLHHRSFVAVSWAPLSSSPRSASQPSALTDTPRTTGELHLSVLLCQDAASFFFLLFFIHAMQVRLVLL